MNVKEIKELIVLMNENNLDELEIEREGMRVKLKKKGDGVESSVVFNQAPAHYSAPAPAKSPAPEAKVESTKNLAEIKAPMVGTFYRAPAPDALPFVEVGQTVKKGDVVCIIEAMKLMNEIKAETAGKVKEILIENGKPVEFGQVIFLIEP